MKVNIIFSHFKLKTGLKKQYHNAEISCISKMIHNIRSSCIIQKYSSFFLIVFFAQKFALKFRYVIMYL